MTSVIGGGLESYMNRRAREQAKNRTAEAEDRAKSIIQEAEADAAEVRESLRKRTEERIQTRRQRALSQARQRAREILMRRREAMMQQVWQQARDRLRQLDDEARLEAVRQLVEDAADQLGGGDLRMQVAERDLQQLDKAQVADLASTLKDHGVKNLTLADTPAHILGGVLVSRASDNELVDNSFDQRLSLARDALHDRVYRLLTEEE